MVFFHNVCANIFVDNFLYDLALSCRQFVVIRMDTNCAPLVAILSIYCCYERTLLLLWIFRFSSVLRLVCLCARLFICALWSPAGKGLTSWLSFVVSTVSLSLSHWYPGSGVVLDCIYS